MAPNVILQFSLKVGSAAQQGSYEKTADHLKRVSSVLNAAGTGLVLLGPETEGLSLFPVEIIGVGAGFVDLSAGILYIADSVVRGNRRSLLKGTLTIGSVFLDLAFDNVGKVGVKRAAHGRYQYFFRSTGHYISYRVGAATVIVRKFLLEEASDLGTDFVAERYGKPRP